MAGKPSDEAPPEESPPPARDGPEREGPLDVERLAKSDGRTLILYTVREPQR
jgi:hypothetical protein